MMDSPELWATILGILCMVIGWVVKSMKDLWKEIKASENRDEQAFRERVEEDGRKIKEGVNDLRNGVSDLRSEFKEKVAGLEARVTNLERKGS